MPVLLPPTLHRFYWEAYTTWLSGFALLCLLYFRGADVYLIDPAVMALSKPTAIVIALGVMVANWVVYDGLCRSSDVQEMLSTRAMPPGDVTGLTDEERAEVLTWIANGARP